MGESEEAMQVFDLAFRNCNPNESELLLLIKVCGPYVWQVSDTTNFTDHPLIYVTEM
ncbi:hypothetical protein OG21DRAFT_1517260 [Imleria badia]|nr:hypothetical protein OG21DRAFT_1517260 [Imleria badia]